MSTPTGTMDDPYVYPGTSVLRNLRGIRDPDVVTKFEADMTTRRLNELACGQAPAQIDANLLQSIHRYIFQDVFDWAGEFRTVNIGKSGDLFALHRHIASSLTQISEQMKAERWAYRRRAFTLLQSWRIFPC